MHISENVKIAIPVESITGDGAFTRANSEKGVVLISSAQSPTDPAKKKARISSAANQSILGTLGGEGDLAKVAGEIVMQATGTFTDAQMAAGYVVTTTTAGKVGPGTAALFGAGNCIKVIITRQGNDATIGDWISVILPQ